MPRYDFWLHGTSVQVEFPDKTKLERKGTGTKVLQVVPARLQKDFNWFHFPIPTPTVIDDMGVTYNDAWLHYSGQDNNARITDVNVYDTAYPTDDCPTCTDGLIYATDLNWKGDPRRNLTTDFVKFDLTDYPALEGAVLSVRVEFARPSGSITFLGAGMTYYRTKHPGPFGNVLVGGGF